MRHTRSRGGRGNGLLEDMQARIAALETGYLRLDADLDDVIDRVDDLEGGTGPVEPPPVEPPPTEPPPPPGLGWGVATTLHEDNTGCRVPLSELDSLPAQRITADNTVLERKRISGDVYVTGKNVILRDCVIDAGGAAYAVRTNSGGSVRLEHCTIIGSKDASIAFDNWQAIRCQISRVQGGRREARLELPDGGVLHALPGDQPRRSRRRRAGAVRAP